MEHLERVAKELGLDRFETRPDIQKIASTLKVKPVVVIAVGFSLIILLLVLTHPGRVVIESTLVFFYPAYKSFQALKTEETYDDRRWLTYWVSFGFFYGFEKSFGILTELISIWPLIRILILVFIMHPRFNGAEILYVKVIRPFLDRYEKLIDQHLDEAESGLKKFGDKAKQTAAENITKNLLKTD